MTEYIKKEDAIEALMCYFVPPIYTGRQVDQAKTIAKTIINTIPLENRLRWIPTNERLPEDFKEVLICFKWGGMEVGDYDSKSKCWDTLDAHVDEDDVVAWQPLPEPYRESEE